MHIILTPAGDHLPGAYTYRTNNQQLIGSIFTPTCRQDFVTALQQFRADLSMAPLDGDHLAGLSAQSQRFIQIQAR